MRSLFINSSFKVVVNVIMSWCAITWFNRIRVKIIKTICLCKIYGFNELFLGMKNGMNDIYNFYVNNVSSLLVTCDVLM
jgi:hypothetical protein